MKKNYFLYLIPVMMMFIAPLFAHADDYKRGDCDHDGTVSIGDVTCLIDYLLTGRWEHDWVDLGLPSGTLWATCNIGAENPEEYGDYFAWGETEPKDYYGWRTYKWCNGDNRSLTKYCTKTDYGDNGFTDNKTELDPQDDAAYVNWGPSWRMPTKEQIIELRLYCMWNPTSLNGVYGFLVKGYNGNSMFLPAAGYVSGSSITQADYSFYWTRELYTSIPNFAIRLWVLPNDVRDDMFGRDTGHLVRAVRVSQN